MHVHAISFCPKMLFHASSHMHDQWEICVCLEGSSILRVGDYEIDYTPGTIVCQPPGILHEHTSEDGFRDLWIKIVDFIPFSSVPVPVFRDDASRRFTALLKMLYESFVLQGPNHERITASLLDTLYQMLVGWSMDRIQTPAVSMLIHDMILHLSDTSFDLADRIREFGYSCDHFRRCFKQETGQTPTAYLIQLRLEHACRLLNLPDCGGFTIKQIAQMSGFDDPYYFSTLFKRKLGCSPLHYLQHRKQV